MLALSSHPTPQPPPSTPTACTPSYKSTPPSKRPSPASSPPHPQPSPHEHTTSSKRCTCQPSHAQHASTPTSPSSSPSPSPQNGPNLQAFTTHIHASLAARPHLLLAYTWTLYLALFAGGRHLRAQLHDSGLFAPESLSFWAFDGEDLKSEFRARVARAEALLTTEERGEVVGEGVRIMGFLVEVVRELEREVGGGVEVRDDTSASGVDDEVLESVQGSVLGMVASLGRSVVGGLGWRYGKAAANPLA
ncbi:hypothetical protein G7Y79_00027g061230 [Physcia stellaris]|nr:hypothetical protein G7Y79_00027g061230 [Physcia stellaris]